MGKTTKCDMKTCQFTQRHFNEEQCNANDDTLSFYIQLFDSLHFYIFHCYQTGYRVLPNNENEMMEEDEKKQNTEYFDAQFARIHSMIRDRDNLTASFERTSSTKNSKFKINERESGGDTTFVDELYKHLESESIDTHKLQTFIKTELYETDSIKNDFSDYHIIANNVNNEECIQSIHRFIKEIAVMSSTFSLGLRFYYWPYYKDKEELSANEQKIHYFQDADNKHDHSGYKVCDLYIIPKYDSFQEEVSNYVHFDIQKYNKAKTKTLKYLKTEQIKKLKAGTK